MRPITLATIWMFFCFKYCENQSLAQPLIPTTCKGFRFDGAFNVTSSMFFLNIQGVRSNLTATGSRTQIVYGTTVNSNDRLRLTRTDNRRMLLLVTFPIAGSNVWQMRFPGTSAQYFNFEAYTNRVKIWITIYDCAVMQSISKCGCK